MVLCRGQWQVAGVAQGPARGLPGTQLGGEEEGWPAEAPSHHGRGLPESALLGGGVSLAVAALRQLLGALRAMQLQEAGDEPGDGFHIAGPGSTGGRAVTTGKVHSDHSRSPKACTSHPRELPTRTQHLPSRSPSSPGPCPAPPCWNSLRSPRSACPHGDPNII